MMRFATIKEQESEALKYGGNVLIKLYIISSLSETASLELEAERGRGAR